MSHQTCARCGATGPTEDFTWRYCWKCNKRKVFCNTYCHGDTSELDRLVCRECDPKEAERHIRRTQS